MVTRLRTFGRGCAPSSVARINGAKAKRVATRNLIRPSVARGAVGRTPWSARVPLDPRHASACVTIDSKQNNSAEGYPMYDTKNLAKLKTIEANAPQAIKAFWAFDKAAMAAGAIPVKYKELMALGVALTTQCPSCLEIHSNKAREAGASEQELAEGVAVDLEAIRA